jgi:hypothetical protein
MPRLGDLIRRAARSAIEDPDAFGDKIENCGRDLRRYVRRLEGNTKVRREARRQVRNLIIARVAREILS